jgi:hypothetical protein
MNLAALNEAASAACLCAAGENALAPSRAYSRGVEKSNPRSTNSFNNAHHRRVFGRTLADAQHRFSSIAANPKGCNHLPILERSAVDQHRAQRNSPRGRSINCWTFSRLASIKFSSHRRLLDTIGVVKILYDRAVVAPRQLAQPLAPHRPAAGRCAGTTRSCLIVDPVLLRLTMSYAAASCNIQLILPLAEIVGYCSKVWATC